jgi:hypothetical protein
LAKGPLAILAPDLSDAVRWRTRCSSYPRSGRPSPVWARRPMGPNLLARSPRRRATASLRRDQSKNRAARWLEDGLSHPEGERSRRRWPDQPVWD